VKRRAWRPVLTRHLSYADLLEDYTTSCALSTMQAIDKDGADLKAELLFTKA
jgi:hypothetical protein